jgi:hypothetical protein
MLQLRWSHAVAAGGFAVLLGLSGCSSDLTRTFGLTRDTPDEFRVTTRAPLSMPPDFTLRPPQPGATRPQEMSARRAAESALVPQAALASGPSGSTSPGEQALVQAAGPPAPADIRKQIDADAAVEADSRSFTDYLMFWRTPAPPPGVAVDPQKEAERLRDNAALGQNMNQGTTPIIVDKPKSFWERLF